MQLQEGSSADYLRAVSLKDGGPDWCGVFSVSASESGVYYSLFFQSFLTDILFQTETTSPYPLEIQHFAMDDHHLNTSNPAGQRLHNRPLQ